MEQYIAISEMNRQ